MSCTINLAIKDLTICSLRHFHYKNPALLLV